MTNAFLNSLSRDVRRVIREFEKDGWILARAKKHIIMKKDGHTFSIPKSPSDPRSLRNTRADAMRLMAIS